MKRLSILIVAILLVATATAGVLTSLDWGIDSTRADYLETKLNVNEINPSYELECFDDDTCKAIIYQDGVVNDFLIIRTKKCVEETEFEGCSRYADKTRTEIIEEIRVWGRSRLETYSDVVKERDTRGEVVIR